MARLQHERICQVNRNHKYSYCPFCAEYQHLPTWMMGFCSENCRNIYNLVMQFKMGYLTPDDAREKLLSYDLTEKDQFEDYIKEQVEIILNPVNQESTPEAEFADVEESTANAVEVEIANTVEEATAPVEEQKVEEPAPAVEEAIAPVEEPRAEEPAVEDNEVLSVSEELKKHNNNRHNKYNKKN